MTALHPGIIVILALPGDTVREGEPLVELVDPVENHVTVLRAPRSGIILTATGTRFAVFGTVLCQVVPT